MLAEMDIILATQLTQPQLTTLLNLCDQQEVEARPWCRLKAEIFVNSFPITLFPSCSVTFGNPLITSTGMAFPPVTGQYVVTVAGQSYAPMQVVPNASSSLSLNLAAPWPGVGANNVGVTLFPMFYSAEAISQPTVVGGSPRGPREPTGNPSLPAPLQTIILQQIIGVRQQTALLRRTHEWINLVDPYRAQSASPSQCWAPAGRDVNDVGQFELWPPETSANAYVVYGLKGHIDMVNPTDLPAVPSAVILSKALMIACESLYTLNGDARYATMIEHFSQRYDAELEKALDEDREQYGTVQQITDQLNSDSGSGQAYPGLDYLYNKDWVGGNY